MGVSTVLVLIDTKTLLCKRYSGKTCVLKVQATSPLMAYEVEQIRVRPDSIYNPEEPILA